MAVLLFMSVTINILAMIYCVYQLRGELTQCHCVSGGDGDNVDQTYEQVDEKQHHTGAVQVRIRATTNQQSLICHSRAFGSTFELRCTNNHSF